MQILKVVSYLILSAFLVVVCASSIPVSAQEPMPLAGPSKCLFPGTTGRAQLVSSSAPGTPPACAMNVCRAEGKQAVRYTPCDADPTCIQTGFTWTGFKVVAGAWGSLPACPSWTNTATWQ